MARGKYDKRRQKRARNGEQQQAKRAPEKATPAGIETGSEPAIAAEASEQQTEKQNGHKEPSSASLDVHDEILKLERQNVRTQWILAGIGVAAVVVSWLQWDAASKQSQSMERQLAIMELDQRPWLQFSTPEMEPLAEGEEFTGIVEVKNTGKTPAKIVEIESRVLVRPRIVVEKFTENSHESGIEFSIDIQAELSSFRKPSPIKQDETVLPAGMAAKSRIRDRHTFTKEEIEVLKTSNFHVIAILTYIRYLDTAERTHETWSCFVYDPISETTYLHTQYGHMD